MRQDRILLACILLGVMTLVGWSLIRPGVIFGKPAPAKAAPGRLLGPADTVQHFYADISSKRYSAAYLLLSDKYRSGTSFAAFCDGYKTTADVTARAIVDGDGHHVTTTLKSVDAYSNGAERHRTYVGAWDLVRKGDRWLLNTGHFNVASETTAVADQPGRSSDDGAASSDQSNDQVQAQQSVDDQAAAIASHAQVITDCVQATDTWKTARLAQTDYSSRMTRPILLKAADRYMNCVTSETDDRSYFNAATSAVSALEDAEKLDGVEQTACDPDRREMAVLQTLHQRKVPVIWQSTLELQDSLVRTKLDDCIEGT